MKLDSMIGARERVGTGSRSTGPSKDDTLAVLAHELRSPLAAVHNSLQFIRAVGPQEKAVDQAVGVMERQVRYMTRLIENLLDLSRIDRGKLVLSKERCDLERVVADAVETSPPVLDERHQELIVSLPPGPLYLESDPTWIRQVLVNLLTNAARYTEPGGHIRLTVETEWNEVIVGVRDDGVGIDPELLPHLFEPYTQGKRSSEGARHGLGIGLALVKRLVELHGGSVEAHSAGAGRGSEFVARLPRLRMLGK
jgi:signal transduction histidine kinase